MSLETLRAAVRERLHLELPDLLLPHDLPHHLPGPLLTTAEPEKLQGLLFRRVDAGFASLNLPLGHRTVGFAGYGSNSYAFYVIAHTEEQRMYLRLHTGGVYTDPVAACAAISNYLPLLVNALERAQALGGRLAALESHGTASYEFLHGESARMCKRPLLGRPDAALAFEALFDLDGQWARKTQQSDQLALRERALKLAMQHYDREAHGQGNVRIGMRVLGAVMQTLRSLPAQDSLRSFEDELQRRLAALATHYSDPHGETAFALGALAGFREDLPTLLAPREGCA